MKLLITSFPLESNFGGGEKMDLLLSEMFRDKGVEVCFWGSCKVLLKEFPKRKFETIKAYLVKDLTSVKSLLFSPVYVFSLLIQALIILPILRLRGYRKIVMLSCIEQFFLTPVALLLGFQIYWWHNLPPRKALLKNPFFFLWKLNTRFVKIIVPSNFVREEFAKVVDTSNIRILFNTVSIVPIERTSLSKDDRLKIGMVCRLSREKGLMNFIKLARDFPQYDFLVVGEGDMRSVIENFVSEFNLQNFELLGFVDPEKISDYLSTLDIFCVLSEYESFGIVAAEASYSGLPVIASNVTALPEVVLDNETGLLYELGNYEDLKKKFGILVKDPVLREKLGKRGHEFVEKNFLPGRFFETAWKIIIEDK